MRQKIDEVFNNIEEKPLFYAESGSRLWGFASPDSDYDVRGFHIQSKRQYYDFNPHRDIIEIMDGDFDFVSYDIDKMFGLLAKSNPTVLEWIRSHVIYFNGLSDWADFQKSVISNFDFKALFYHYLSLANSQLKLMLTDKNFTYKKTFYCIRGLLSAELAKEHTMPELIIDELFNQFEESNDILSIAKESLEIKKQKNEKQEVLNTDKERIIKAINLFVQKLESKPIESTNNRKALESVLTDYCFNIKAAFYK